MKPAISRESSARRYRIEKYLTEGGMGAIYLGKKMGSGGFEKEVVLKQLLPEYTSRPEFRDLFFREAKISATLDHANIVHTFDLVESDQSLFIVMEYVRGADLRTILRRARQRRRELSPAAAIHIALEILAGLNYAHARRDRAGNSLAIIHRDVSPSNIICSAQGEAKLSDFGIAKASTHSSVFYRVRGKVGYMSPEQARSFPIDHRCDLYSLGVCFYESLSGERLFVGDLNTPADEIYGHPILPISQKRAGLPPALDAVLAKALDPDIAQRYQSGAEFSDALRTVAHRTGLALSAPELASHLRDILGDDPGRWLRDDGSVAPTDAQGIPAASIGLVGQEAASIGIVADVPDDGEPPIVLNPRAVSGSKDFDLDSMLNDEATRPGIEKTRPGGDLTRTDNETTRTDNETTRTGDEAPRAGHAATRLGNGATRTDRKKAQAPFRPEATTPEVATSNRPGTPPPVWTRDSGPVRVLASLPARAVPAAPPTPPTNRLPVLAPVAVATVPPPAPARKQRTTIPPPVPPPARTVLPPPPPKLPAPIAETRGRASYEQEFEDATPPPPVGRADAPHVASFDIEESTLATPPPRATAQSVRPSGRPLPGRAYIPVAYPVPEPAAPQLADGPRLSQPQTIDFSDSVRALLPVKASGPPRWLAVTVLGLAIVGGAFLGNAATHDQVERTIAAAETSRKPRPPKPAPAPEPAAKPAAVVPGKSVDAEATPAAADPPPPPVRRAATARSALGHAQTRNTSAGRNKAKHKPPAQKKSGQRR